MVIKDPAERRKYFQKYFKTEKGKKANRIQTWKYIGVISDDYNKLYEEYLAQTNCEFCNIPLHEGRTGKGRKCLDHDHETGQFRNILCCSCNVKRG